MRIVKMNMNFYNNSSINNILFLNNLYNDNNIKTNKTKNMNLSTLIFQGKKTCGSCGSK